MHVLPLTVFPLPPYMHVEQSDMVFPVMVPPVKRTSIPILHLLSLLLIMRIFVLDGGSDEIASPSYPSYGPVTVLSWMSMLSFVWS